MLSSCGTTSHKDIQGITYENLSVAYDETEHELLISGQLPPNGTVTYINNKRTKLGVSQAKAIVSAPGYLPLTLEAELEILKSFSHFSNLKFENKTIVYDGFPHTLALQGDLPNGVEVFYTSDREEVANSATAIGTYEIKAHLSGGGYYPTTMKANLTIQPRPAHETKYLFIGDSFLDKEFYVNFDLDWDNVPLVDNIAVGGTTIDYWSRRISDIKQKDPESIVMHLGINDINGGMADIDVVLALTSFFDKLWSNMPDLNIYWISISPNTSFVSYAPVWTFVNTSITDYARQFPQLTVIDFASKMYYQDQLIKSFLKDGLHLSNSGYILFANTIKESLGLQESSGENFGESASLGVSSGFNLSDDQGPNPLITATSFIESQAYLKNSYSKSFYAAMRIQVISSDDTDKPIAGISVANVFANILFYVDTSNSTHVKAGVIKHYEEELWDYALVQEETITSAPYYDFEVVKDADDFYFSVNGQAIIKTSDYLNHGEDDYAVVGAYTIGTKARFSNYSIDFTSNKIAEKTPSTTELIWDQGEYDDWAEQFPISFGSSKHTGSFTGDDLYAQMTKSPTQINIAISGYGDFSSDEQINIIFNYSPHPTRTWNLGSENIYFKILSNGNTYYRANRDEVFSYQIAGDGALYKSIVITREGNNFSMNLSINVADFSFLTAHLEFEMVMLQSKIASSSMLLYNGINGASVSKSMHLYGKERGDLAVSSNYVYVGENGLPNKANENVKDVATFGYPISFSNPEDVKHESANDYFANITRLGNYFEIEILAFGEMKSDEYIRMVMHVGEDTKSVWGLSPNDTSLSITRNGDIFFKSNLTEYFQWGRLDSSRDPKLASSHYSYSFSYHEDGYSVIRIVIPDLSIFGPAYSGDLKLLLAQWNMGEFGDSFLNAEPFVNLMRLNNASKGDPAFQKNYLSLSTTGTIL